MTHSGNTENPPEADVTIASCGPDEFGVGWMADLVIVNNSSEPSSYFVTVSGLDAAGVVVGQGFGSASGIQPGVRPRRSGARAGRQDGSGDSPFSSSDQSSGLASTKCWTISPSTPSTRTSPRFAGGVSAE